MKTYEEVINYLFEHLPYYQRVGPAAYKDNLNNTLSLDRMYGNPHKKYKTIHIAGTNGKGSVSNMLASVLKEAGYRTGLYTSPHLKDFRERIRVNGEMVNKDFIVNFINDFLIRNKDISLEPSFFELTVLMAFEYFAKQVVDVAVIEVGLGGRLDSTNIITPILSVITNISYDHTSILGDTLGKIALEKAGIIKKKIPVIVGESHPETEIIFKGVAENKSAPVIFADQNLSARESSVSADAIQIFNIKKGSKTAYKNLGLDLQGRYQRKNICTVLAAIEELQKLGWTISEQHIREGFGNVVKNTGLPGRWQIIGKEPLIICDIAHNTAGIKEVVAQLKQTPHKKLHIILGTVNDKDIDGILYLLPKEADYYFTRAQIPRALDEKYLMSEAAHYHLKGSSYDRVSKALEAAIQDSGKEDLILVCGSTFVVAEAIP